MQRAIKASVKLQRRTNSVEVPQCPVFRPTPDEFADPFAYIESITPDVAATHFSYIQVAHPRSPRLGGTLPCSVPRTCMSPSISLVPGQAAVDYKVGVYQCRRPDIVFLSALHAILENHTNSHGLQM